MSFANVVLADPGRVVVVQARCVQRATPVARAGCTGRCRRSPYVVSRRHRCGPSTIRYRGSNPAGALLLLAPGYGDRGKVEAQQLGDRVYQTGALATFNAPERYRWFAQPVIAQALMTRLLVAQHSDAPTVDRLTRSLLALRRNGSWGCACQNAVALDALVDVAVASGPPANLKATATIGTATIAMIAFTGHRAAVQTSNVAAAHLTPGTAADHACGRRCRSAALCGNLSDRLAGPQRGQLNGLRVTRIVHPAGAANALATMGLALLAQPVALQAAQVFDIELQVITDHPIDRVQITDPLPAGMEAVDTSFKNEHRRRTGAELANRRSANLSRSHRSLRRSPRPRHLRAATTSPARSPPAPSPGPAPKRA